MAITGMFRPALWLLPVAGCLLLAGRSSAADAKKVNANVREIAGSSEVLRSVPKKFATLKAVDTKHHRVTLHVEGEKLPTAWPLTPDAEVKVAGWWGRLDQFTAGDRIWAWFKINRAGKPVAVFMLADELSQQELQGPGVKVEAKSDDRITIPAKGKSRVLQTKGTQVTVKAGDKGYVQSAGERARLVLSVDEFSLKKKNQQAALRRRWQNDGLPGTVTFLHLSGEMDFMLDHEAMRWGRSLRPGDKVSLVASPAIPAVVKQVRPWRERTQLRLVLKGADLADLTIGQRLGLKMTPPSAEVEKSELPPDLGRLKNKKDRVEWFLASIYCTCGVSGNTCTGHFYTLASCNPNACGMPNHMRRVIAEKIDKGMTDKQIFTELLKDQGPDLLRPHLLP